MITAENSIAEMVAVRRQIKGSLSGEAEDFDADMEIMDRLDVAETLIEKATYEAKEDKRLGNAILMEDHPSFWDHFQERLFLRMQQFA